ncbi:MAG: TonB-dependent receptor [Chryseolinea sp.]
MFKLLTTAAVILWVTGAYAQGYAITGKVQRNGSTQILSGATVEIVELGKYSVADEFGNYRFVKIDPGQYTINARFVGFKESTQHVNVTGDTKLDILLDESAQITDEVVIYATRAGDKTPTSYTEVGKQAIQKQNFGQDLPMILNWTPSMVTTSDAGAGIGYTGIRIRGSDATRINVTINGIALNDSESQGVFWVNTPDLSSSVQSVQVQRGVGTSTNGSGAFGATVSVQTDALNKDSYAEAMASAGSFNSQRYTFKGGTGLINNRWAFDGRISRISSDGYIERATSDLNSYYLSGGYYGDKTIIKAITFGGHEQTYQSWYGTDPATLAIDRRFNYAGAIYDSLGNVSKYYDKEIDDYKQDHYQLHISQFVSEHWNANLSFHYTYGRGFFEQYKQDETFAALGVENVTVGGETFESTDVIVRQWLDNKYYGTTFSVNYDQNKTSLTIGGAYSRYDNAKHFGEVLWAAIATNLPARYMYYKGESQKSDFNIYAKWNYAITTTLSSYIDLQYRRVDYKSAGIEDEQVPYSIGDTFNFFNPKAGLTFALNENSALYTSYGIANREPNRSDYLNGADKPKSEHMGNLEFGWKKATSRLLLQANYYLMNYKNQLVLTGGVTDTGYPIRANVGKSYRSGVEVSGTLKLSEKVSWNANATWSANKNSNYKTVDESNNVTERKTTIILSPSWIAGSQLTWMAFANFQTTLLTKYVGKQYLDNTQSENVSLNDYLINDIRIAYQLHPKGVQSIDFALLVNNLFNVKYASNGYGYGGVPYYFPQAGTNFLAMITVKLAGNSARKE